MKIRPIYLLLITSLLFVTASVASASVIEHQDFTVNFSIDNTDSNIDIVVPFSVKADKGSKVTNYAISETFGLRFFVLPISPKPIGYSESLIPLRRSGGRAPPEIEITCK